MNKLIGPFSQILTMSNLPLHGALSDNKIEVIEKAGVVISGDKIIEVGNFEDLLIHQPK